MTFARVLFIIGFVVAYDLFLGLVGVLLSRLNPGIHPWLYRCGLRHLAMCTFFGSKILPSRCSLDCSTEKCGNWTCPRYQQL